MSEPRSGRLAGLSDDQMLELGSNLREAFERDGIDLSKPIEKDEDYFAFERAEREARKIRESTRRLVAKTRVAQQSPTQALAHTARLLDMFRSYLARATRQHVDPQDYRGELERARALIKHVASLTPQRSADIRARARDIGPAQLPDVLTLLLLANPGSPEYWDLARATREHVHALNMSVPLHREWRWLLGALIAPHEYAGENEVASPPRGASRATHVESVTPAGLPSLGKRA
ncbi:MAG: hypothetical protein L0G94_10640 [Brachybacterium sp.]|uniref:hypothetical protein n=1 Tax=Brachybacterium sp. TaxID=1891286 RepID=UPI00264A03F3|nr:hypothetical protein [Brachybacterium sp.]MDN5687113.1 hypothetical protein [Brachybacterium sp.]